MNWDREAEEHSGRPFDDPPERQRLRLAEQKVRDEAERRAATKRLWAGARRWGKYLSGAFIAFVAVVVAAGQLPEALAKIVRLFTKGTP